MTGSPDMSLAQGPIRISGAALNAGASWHVASDRLGWTTVVLLGSAPTHVRTSSVDAVVRKCAEECADPLRTALAIRERLGNDAHDAELGVLRIGPRGEIVEVLNATLPAVIHWEPREGFSPYEQVTSGLRWLNSRSETDMVRLRPGGALLATTRGVLPHDAGWSELNRFVHAIALDPLGGLVAEAPPTELARLLRTSWVSQPGPAAFVVIGMPPVIQQVA